MPRVKFYEPEGLSERIKELRAKYPDGFMSKNQIGKEYGHKNNNWKTAFVAPLTPHKSLTSTRTLYRIEDVARRELAL